MNKLRRFLTLAVIIVLGTAAMFPKAILDPKLQQKISMEAGPFQVIVTFKNHNDITSMTSLGVPYLPLQVLPMCGTILTKDGINTVLSWNNVESVYLNDRLNYFNYDAAEITGAHYVQDVLKYKGKGITILVLDSGVDATHPDLPFRSKVVENVKIVSDLGTFGTTAFIEGTANTDNTSGHGTHVAGIAGGTGEASASDERYPYYYKGVAPEASLVGVGAGEALLILNALVGFDYAIATQERFKTSIITNSWGNSSSQYDPNDPISKASYEAYRRGIIVTFAAGNDGPDDNTMSSYAINPWVIGVAAGTKTKDLADFSSRGEASEPYEHPDITAPGVDIISTRAVGTPVGALGPVIDPSHPGYSLYYASLSGTSMATPFVAGTAALILNANPQLSPDQVENIITSTADVIPNYPFHRIGAGYINVRNAVQKALLTKGNRLQFLSGDTKWTNQGEWVFADDNNSNLTYFGSWEIVSSQNASGGSYKAVNVKMKGGKVTQKPLMRATFYGTSVKLQYPTNKQGGTAELFIDGASRGIISFYSDEQQWNVRKALSGLENTNHTLELRGMTGKMYIDNLYLDGKLFPGNTEFVSETSTYPGTMGPSVQGIPETRLIPFDVDANTIQLSAEIGWTGGVDIDLSLLNPEGNEVASSATLDNPEAFTYWTSKPGIYTYKIVGYTTIIADYTLSSTQIKAVQNASLQKTSKSDREKQTAMELPTEITLKQNHPNPFNPNTTISYSLPEGQYIQLKVYDLLGKEVALLVDGYSSAGIHTVKFNGENLPSSMYFYQLTTTSGYRSVKKMLLMK